MYNAGTENRGTNPARTCPIKILIPHRRKSAKSRYGSPQSNLSSSARPKSVTFGCIFSGRIRTIAENPYVRISTSLGRKLRTGRIRLPKSVQPKIRSVRERIRTGRIRTTSLTPQRRKSVAYGRNPFRLIPHKCIANYSV